MASALAEEADAEAAEAREARIAQLTDARCLENMLRWLKRTYFLLPLGMLWAWLAWKNGAGAWSLVWFAGWAGTQVHVYVTAGRLQTEAAVHVQSSIRRAIRLYWIGAVVLAVLLPQFFVSSSVETKLGISLLLTTLSGATVISCSGIAGAYVGVMLPLTAVLVAGWLWHGGVLGFGLAFLYTLGTLGGISAVWQQRQSWEELIRLLDDNEILSASLKAERDRAEAASESKTRFFAAASHDLRQPLHALSINATTLDLVARRSSDPLLTELSQGIGSALRQSRSLLDGLLDISRLDAHSVALHPAPHDVAALLEAVRNEFAALAEQRGLSLSINAEPLWVMTDADQLLRILGNLVDNAIKFTPSGGVRLLARGSPDGRLIVSVSDSGPGIAEAERERVFEEFYQVGNPSRDRSQGLGLGLAIVKRTARLLDIPLELVCEPGHGARFELSLPAASAAAVLPMPAKEPGSGRALSVLMVDDEPDTLRSLCTYLREIGWTAHGVASGEEAGRAQAEGFCADVLVVDFRLRGETGQDVITRLRLRQPALPAVIVTGDTAAQRLRALSGLAATVLHKPVDGARLARALSEAVEAGTGGALATRQSAHDAQETG